MNNNEVAHLWANKSRPSGHGSHFFFEGDTIYSYGTHFPIARHWKGAVLFTTKGYSVTTSCHIGRARNACTHLQVFYVEDPTRNPGKADLDAYAARIERAALQAGRARTSVNWHLESLERLVAEANAFAGLLGSKRRFSMPDAGTINKLKERAKASAEKERKAARARQERIEQETKLAVEQWLAGANVHLPYGVQRVYLRVNGDQMETSKGARVPLADAQRTFQFVTRMRERGWYRNGDTFKVGDYQLDAVNEQGVVAGCHRVIWEEIERFALVQGWTVPA